MGLRRFGSFTRSPREEWFIEQQKGRSQSGSALFICVYLVHNHG
jgi:hypothetical protein